MDGRKEAHNVRVVMQGNEMWFCVDLTKPEGPSDSGLSTILGSTHGIQDLPAEDGSPHEGIGYSVNVFRKIKGTKAKRARR